MVEALAAGTPVLAADRGGARDIVRPGRDGVLISDPTDAAQIRAGSREIAAGSWDAEDLREGAKRFSEERFRERLGDVLRAHGAS
jgi:glycosyltransferase involved in cell wall biosynthesis